jgi:hypothetical protein
LVSRALGGGCFWFACRSLYLIDECLFGYSAYIRTLFLFPLYVAFKSPSLAFLVLARILFVLNKFHFNFFKKNKIIIIIYKMNFYKIFCLSFTLLIFVNNMYA